MLSVVGFSGNVVAAAMVVVVVVVVVAVVVVVKAIPLQALRVPGV
jgi:hypothetical protein